MPAPFGTPDISASVTDLSSLKNVWLALHIAGGQVLLPLAVLTFIFAPKSASRHRYITLVNFCVSWIVYSLVYCLLLYSGQVSTTPDAPSNLCIAQASLIHGAPPMSAVAGLEMVLQLWLVQKGIHRNDVDFLRRIPKLWINVLILLPPYIVFFAFSGMTLAFALGNENTIFSLNAVYCTSENYSFSLIVPIFCAVIMASIMFIEGVIAFNWYKTRREVNMLLAPQLDMDTVALLKVRRGRRLSVSISVRVGLFSLYCIATLSACVVFATNMSSRFPYMVEASLPLAAFLLFGTQRDLLDVWLCRCSRRKLSMTSSWDDIPAARRPALRPLSIGSIVAPSILSQSITISPAPSSIEDVYPVKFEPQGQHFFAQFTREPDHIV